MRKRVQVRSVCLSGMLGKLSIFVLAAALFAGCSSPPTVPTSAVHGPEFELRSRFNGAIPKAIWTAADPVGNKVELFENPDEPLLDDNGDPQELTNPTFEDVPLVLRVLRKQGPWLLVNYPDRPNGVTAWVRADQVQPRPVAHRIEVHREAARVLVFHGNEKVAEYPAAMGAEVTPTPLGHFYVDVRVLLADTSGPYGAGQVSVTGFSEIYETFGGGRGQIAIHGTNLTSLIGTPVSNGCIRIANEDLLELIETVPAGAPVDIIS